MTEIAITFLIVAALIVYVPRVFFLALGLAVIFFLLLFAEHAQFAQRDRQIACKAKIAEPVPYKNGRPDYQAELAAALSAAQECSSGVR